MNDGWLFHEDNGNIHSITLPAITDPGADNKVIISNQIPDTGEHISSIGILTTHQSIIVSINNQVVYSRMAHPRQKPYFNVPLGSIWDIIPLESDVPGKIITIELFSEYPDYAGRINEIHIGTKASILLHTIDHFGIGFLLSLIICIMGTFLIFLYHFIKKLIRADKSLYYLGWLSLISGIWLLTASNLTQMFISNAYLISTVSYLALMTFPIPILLHVNMFAEYHYKKLNTWFIYILLTSDLLIIFLQFTNIRDFHETLPLTYTLLLLILGTAMITLWLDLIKYKNSEVKIFTLAASTLFIFSIIEVYMSQYQSEQITGGFFRIGFYAFLFILAWDGITRIVDYIKLSERAVHYRQLAYRDPLTNCRNRIAYEIDIEKIDTERNVTIFMADMNNMKEINDTYGHQIGDEAIILCSQCLIKVFGRSVYRIGGDEYLCIKYNLTQDDINNQLLAFYEECNKTNEDIEYKIILSVGYASYDPTFDMTIHDTIKRADNMMYEVKEMMKKGKTLLPNQ
jgi:diguanylate cyclase (GGDEF)-like protein